MERQYRPTSTKGEELELERRSVGSFRFLAGG